LKGWLLAEGTVKFTEILSFLSDENGDPIDNTEYPRVLFLMHKWFISSEDLVDSYVNLYPLLVKSSYYLVRNKAFGIECRRILIYRWNYWEIINTN
jgi:hypothetical protein